MNANNLAAVIYCYDEDRQGFIGKFVEVGLDFSHEEFQSRYSPDKDRTTITNSMGVSHHHEKVRVCLRSIE